MKDFLKHNSIYILLYALVMLYAANLLLNEGKVQIHRDMNAVVGNKTLDQAFAYLTHLGDGLLALMVAIAISFKSVRSGLYILLSYAGAGVLSYILKHWIYYDVTRPHFVFQYYVREELKLIDGVDILALHSFPSGHSLSAFALFFCLIFITKNHFLKISFFLLAVVAAYSRVYLSQHWLIDIFVGSFIGFSFALLMYFIFYKNTRWSELDSGLKDFIKKRKEPRV